MKVSNAFSAALLLLSFYAPRTNAQAATINWNKVDQVIDGFGASDVGASAPLTAAQAALFFSPTSGVGLSLLRTGVPIDGSCMTVNAVCAGAVSDMNLAIANGARVWSTPWSPPAAMKSNGSVNNGGFLLADSYGPYAVYLANYVKSLSSLYGINLFALSVQNEPEITAAYGSAIWSAANFDAFVGTNLGPTFGANGLAPLITFPETGTSEELPQYASTTMSDLTAGAYVGIIATHDYSFTTPSYPQGQVGGKHLWQTEISDPNPFDPSMANAIKYAQLINDWMTVANANAWHYWQLIGIHGDNQGLTEISGAVSKRLYVMGNYSKFVRPGFYRIDVTPNKPQSYVSISAYKNGNTGALVVVVVNQNATPISQTFNLNGILATSATPWVTSSTLNLVSESEISVSGGSFTYTLPATSVTSFVVTTNLAHPTGLTTIVK